VSQVELTSGCIIGVMCNVTSNETITDNTVISGSSCDRRVARERPPVSQLQTTQLYLVVVVIVFLN
jgi:dynactin-6